MSRVNVPQYKCDFLCNSIGRDAVYTAPSNLHGLIVARRGDHYDIQVVDPMSERANKHICHACNSLFSKMGVQIKHIEDNRIETPVAGIG